MTKEEATRLAAALPIGLGSHGVCPACLSFVVFALDGEDERRVAGQVTSIAPVLWGEGLDVTVRAALEAAVSAGASTRPPRGSPSFGSAGSAARCSERSFGASPSSFATRLGGRIRRR